ncbi:MAG TPA: DNA replication/repair protein RecF [Candidatus Kapabacteria bacterium]|nr:DNA replication/repair protein RecF [Candidatus Kapabacteria bacterium]
MHLRRVSFRNLRNHAATELEVAQGANVITGLNGEGKTTILEAISIATLTRSFVGTPDAHMVRRGRHSYDVRIEGVSDYGVPRRIEVAYDAAAGRTALLDGTPAANAAQVIGSAPTVVLSPDMKAITNGAPAERRRFLDMVISQAKRRYLEDLMQYRRVLKQRNALLAMARRSGRPADRMLLEPWDEGLVERAAHLMYERTIFLREFEPIFRDAATRVASGIDRADIHYLPDAISAPLASVADYRDALWFRCREVAAEEARRGTTLFGAHRDDLRMEVNGGDVRVAASQGQHKTLLIGLKIAEFHYLASQCAETPLILLDDIFGELDPQRAERVYELTRTLGQTFITAASLDILPFLNRRGLGPGEAQFSVQEGAISSIRYGRIPPSAEALRTADS